MNSRPAVTLAVFASLFLGCKMDLNWPGPPGGPLGPCSDACSPEGSSECDGNRAVQT